MINLPSPQDVENTIQNSKLDTAEAFRKGYGQLKTERAEAVIWSKSKRNLIVAGAIILILLCLLAGGAFGQDVPLPPAITATTLPRCTVATHGVQVEIDAKTGLTTERFMYRVQPSATTGKKTWRGNASEYVTMDEALAKCRQFVDAVRNAKTRRATVTLSSGQVRLGRSTQPTLD